MTALVRAAALTRFEAVAMACGLDARALVAEVGLPAHCLEDSDLMLPAAGVAALLELAAERGGEPAFGLRMAASRRLSNLGALGLLVREQPTLRHALGALVRHIHLHNEAIDVTLEEAEGLLTIREEMQVEGAGATRQAIEMSMGTTHRLLTVILGESWRPRMVGFRHDRPPSTEWHRRVFGTTVIFHDPINSVVCNAADLDVPNPAADPVMARYTRQLLELEHGKRPSTSEQVRRLAVLLLPRGQCKVEVVARHLGVDRRTVANRLAAEQTTFSALVDGMRRELLQRCLAEGAYSLSQVSALLGLSEPSSFSRWHRRQFGRAARTLRQSCAARCSTGAAPPPHRADHRHELAARKQAASGAGPARQGIEELDRTGASAQDLPEARRARLDEAWLIVRPVRSTERTLQDLSRGTNR